MLRDYMLYTYVYMYNIYRGKNVPQYDNVLNNKKYLKFHMLEVTEFSSDFQSVKHKYNL